MLVTLFGIVTLLRLVQSEKANSKILVTLFGIVMLVSPVQPEKAELPMLVTLFGIVTLVSPVKSPLPNAGNAVWYGYAGKAGI